MTAPSDFLSTPPPIVRTAAEIAALGALISGGEYQPGLNQLFLASDTGVMSYIDASGALAAVPTPGGGGSSITVPTGSGGLTAGYLGIEYNGDAVEIGTGINPVVFDTVYSDPLTNASAALAGPLETADYIFDVDGITIKNAGLYSVDLTMVNSAVSSLVEVTFLGVGTGSTDYNLPTDARIAEWTGLIAAPAGAKLSISCSAGDSQTATYNYGAIAVTKLMGV